MSKDRTTICLWIILLGLANFLAYTVIYALIGGEAVNGNVVVDQAGRKAYLLQSGHEVSMPVFIYSGIHSISIWITVAAIMLAMLTLAKDRISSSMRSAVVRGRAIITVFAIMIAIACGILTFAFSHQFVEQLTHVEQVAETMPAERS